MITIIKIPSSALSGDTVVDDGTTAFMGPFIGPFLDTGPAVVADWLIFIRLVVSDFGSTPGNLFIGGAAVEPGFPLLAARWASFCIGTALEAGSLAVLCAAVVTGLRRFWLIPEGLPGGLKPLAPCLGPSILVVTGPRRLGFFTPPVAPSEQRLCVDLDGVGPTLDSWPGRIFDGTGNERRWRSGGADAQEMFDKSLDSEQPEMLRSRRETGTARLLFMEGALRTFFVLGAQRFDFVFFSMEEFDTFEAEVDVEVFEFVRERTATSGRVPFVKVLLKLLPLGSCEWNIQTDL